MRQGPLFALAIAAFGFACVENDAPGNDREASLEAPEPAAEMMPVDSALDGVSMKILQPEIMTDADIASVPDLADRCRFRFTRVGLPVFLFSADAGVIKLNGKLVRLPASAEGHYQDGAVSVTHRELDDREEDGPFSAELVLRLQGLPDELGFHGFSECS